MLGMEPAGPCWERGRPRRERESVSGSGRRAFLALAVGALVAVNAVGCKGTNDSQRPPPDGAGTLPASGSPAATPAEFAGGERLFDASCSRCHGFRGGGTDQGPPLVHVIYEPNHHSDAAFQLAAAQGVRAHHWSFGDMPPVAAVTPEQVGEIVDYIRWLQREAGIGS